MPILTKSVALVGDDGWFREGAGYDGATNCPVGTISGALYGSFLRFTGLSIPRGSTIVSATLQVTADEINTNPVTASIACEAADSATAPANAQGWTRPRTTARTSWTFAFSSMGSTAKYTTPDFGPSVQEVVNRPGWASGNPLVVYLDPVGTPSGRQAFKAVDQGAATAATLTIEYVEPVTVTVPVAASADDGYFSWAATQNNSSSQLQAGVWSGRAYSVYTRFLGVSVPQGATILDAYLEVLAYDGGDSGTVLTHVRAHAVDSAPPIAYPGDARSLPRTSASVEWSLPTWAYGTRYKSPNLASVVQEIVDRPAWAAGNDLTLLVDYYDEMATTGGYRRFTSYDGSASQQPKLVVTFSTSGAQQPPSNALPDTPLNVSATDAPVGSPVTVTWSPSDPDGDPQASAKVRYKKTADATWVELPEIVGTDTTAEISGSSGFSDLVLSRSPLLYYKFDEATGNPQDASGNNNHGTNTGTVTPGVAGELNSSVQYGGGRTVIANGGGVAASTAMSVEFRAKKTVANQEHVVFRWAAAERIFSTHLAWSDGTVYFDAGNGATVNSYDRISKSASGLTLTNWHHYVFVKDASTGFMGIYVDGVLWHSGTGKNQSIGTSTSGALGGYADGQYPMSGYLDEFVVYDRALTAAEVAESYNARLSQSMPLDAGTYEVQVATADTEGYGPWSASTTFVVGGVTPPTNLQVSVASSTQLDLSWDAVTGASGYDIERDGQIIATDVTATTFSDTGLSTGVEYAYRVRAVR